MKKLVEAWKILSKYVDDAELYFEHDIMYIDVPVDNITDSDIEKLNELGIYIDIENGGFYMH